VAATGWTHEEVESLTLPRLRELNRHWATYPPAHISISRIFNALTGYKPPAIASKSEPVKTLEDFIGDFVAQGGQIEVKGQSR